MRPRRLPDGAGLILPLPHVPAGRSRCGELGVLGVETDSHRQRVVQARVEPEQQPVLEVDAKDQGGIDPGDVAADGMPLLVPAGLAAVADLPPALVRRTVWDTPPGHPERVHKQADSLVLGALHSQVHRSSIRGAGIEHPPTACLDGGDEEGVDVAPSGHRVDAGVVPAGEAHQLILPGVSGWAGRSGGAGPTLASWHCVASAHAVSTR